MPNTKRLTSKITNITRADSIDNDRSPVRKLSPKSAASDFFGAGDYPTYVPGIGHGRCVTFGRMAGINAAGGNADEKIPDLDLFA